MPERTGNFSDLLSLAKPQIIKDPLTGKPFPGNIIPAARLAANPPGTFFAAYMPLPNQVRGTTSYNTVAPSMIQALQRGDGRVDWQINTRNQILGRYSINDNQETDPNQFTTLGAQPLESRGQNATATLTHIWNPRWLSEARVSYYRSIFHFNGILQGTNFNQKAGVQGFDDTTSIFGFPEIVLTNYATSWAHLPTSCRSPISTETFSSVSAVVIRTAVTVSSLAETFITSAPALSMAPIRPAFLHSAGFIRATHLLTSCWAFRTMSPAITTSS